MFRELTRDAQSLQKILLDAERESGRNRRVQNVERRVFVEVMIAVVDCQRAAGEKALLIGAGISARALYQIFGLAQDRIRLRIAAVTEGGAFLNRRIEHRSHGAYLRNRGVGGSAGAAAAPGRTYARRLLAAEHALTVWPPMPIGTQRSERRAKLRPPENAPDSTPSGSGCSAQFRCRCCFQAQARSHRAPSDRACRPESGSSAGPN